jgi:hypothetical protein
MRSTNINDPAWRARSRWTPSSGGKGRESAPFALLEGLLIKGAKTFARDCCVRGDTPASVRSPHAPARSPKPCRNITIDTTSPKGKINSGIQHLGSTKPTSNGIQRERGKNPGAYDGKECNKTRIGVAPMMDSVRQKNRTLLFVCNDLRYSIQPLL